MWELDHKEGWVPNNWCFHTVVLESPLDSKEIKLVNPKGNQPWIFIRRIVAEADAPILWPPDAKNWLILQERPWSWGRLKVGGERDDRGWDGWMASPIWWTWVWASCGSGDGQGSLVCYSPWDCKESDATQLNWNELNRTDTLKRLEVQKVN